MQPALCILLIAATMAWFGIAMVRTNSTYEQSKVHTAEAVQLAESQPAASASPEILSNEDRLGNIDPDNRNEEVSVASDLPLVDATARDPLVIKLPVSKRPRSNDESTSLIKHYLLLHQEFLASEQCLSNFSEQISAHPDGEKWVGRSILGGSTFLRRKLGQRLRFRQTMDSDNPSLGLVLEARAESQVAAEGLADYLTREYLVLIGKEETLGNHPRLLEMIAALERSKQKALELETQLKTFKLKNKALFQAEPKDKVEALLDACRQNLKRQETLLKAIGKIFVNGNGNFEGLAELNGFEEFKKIQLTEQTLGALKQALARSQGRAEKKQLQELQNKVHALRSNLENEITLVQGNLENQRQKLREREFSLRRQVLKSQQSSDELSLRFPKLQELQDAKKESVSLGKKIGLLSLQWSQSCKHLKVSELRDNQIKF